MPIYEYQCQECGHHFDAMQKISDDPLKECPSCKANALKKLISAPAFHLKGSGWYVTDFKDSKKPESNKTSSTSQSESKPSPSSNSDSTKSSKKSKE